MGLEMGYIVFACMLTMVRSSTYIVHMDLSSMPTPYSGPHSWYQATLQSVSPRSLAHISTNKHVYTYMHAIHGFSASLTPLELEALKQKPGYLFSTRDTSVRLFTTRSAEFLGLHTDFGVWPKSSYGKDVIIGFVDSGIWPESKSYNDNGLDEIPSRWKGECEFNSSVCNKKIIGARYFYKGYLKSKPKAKISVYSPEDTMGHGTHTSSIAAGNFVKEASFFGYGMGTAKGMAPHARLAIYKIFWNNDTFAVVSDIVAAIDQAIIDGVDVLSLSLGTSILHWQEDPVAIASFTANEKGIFVSMACGNEGPLTLTVSNPMPWVLTVAAGSIDRQFTGLLTLGNGNFIPGVTLYQGKFNSSRVPMIFMGECNNISDAYKARNKIVVCFSENSLPFQFNVIRGSKAAAGVFITNKEYLLDVRWYDYPMVFLDVEEGRTVRDYIKDKGAEATAKINFHLTRLGNVRAPIVSRFSSRGPIYGFPHILKPDLMAPGQQILGSWPNKVRPNPFTPDGSLSNFNIISGTSMACPQATGLAAILKAVHPDWSTAAIRSAMMTSSSITDNTFNPIQEIGGNDITEATPLSMGSGHISPNKALEPGLVYDLDLGDYVNLLCGWNLRKSRIQMITKSSAYNCSNPTLDVNYPSFSTTFGANEIISGGKVIKVFQRTVTSVEDGESIYRATLTGLNGLIVKVEPQTLTFTRKTDKKSFEMTIEGPALKDYEVVHGYLTWVRTTDKKVVRSPIVVMGRGASGLEPIVNYSTSQSNPQTLKHFCLFNSVTIVVLLGTQYLIN